MRTWHEVTCAHKVRTQKFGREKLKTFNFVCWSFFTWKPCCFNPVKRFPGPENGIVSRVWAFYWSKKRRTWASTNRLFALRLGRQQLHAVCWMVSTTWTAILPVPSRTVFDGLSSWQLLFTGSRLFGVQKGVFSFLVFLRRPYFLKIGLQDVTLELCDLLESCSARRGGSNEPINFPFSCTSQAERCKTAFFSLLRFLQNFFVFWNSEYAIRSGMKIYPRTCINDPKTRMAILACSRGLLNKFDSCR